MMGYRRIENKDDLAYFMECDKVALRIPESRKRPRPVVDVIWKYEILLRKVEYYSNGNQPFDRLLRLIDKARLKRLGVRLGFAIEPFVFGPGLSIAHYGCVVVHPNARVGANCRIHEGVTIGATNGSSKAAVIGDNCFLGSGAKIIGDVRLGDDTAVGAGAVVVKSFEGGHMSLGGVPAKRISDNDSSSNVVKATDIVSRNKELAEADRGQAL